MFVTEHSFTLPQGYLDSEGTLHRNGVMRLATAADEIIPLRDPRVQKNPAYLVIILLSRVITSLGEVRMIDTAVIEGLFVGDLKFLERMYNRINHGIDDEDAGPPEGQMVAEGLSLGNGHAPRPR